MVILKFFGFQSSFEESKVFLKQPYFLNKKFGFLNPSIRFSLRFYNYTEILTVEIICYLGFGSKYSVRGMRDGENRKFN